MRAKNGQYKKIPFLHSNWNGLKLMIGITSIGFMLNTYFEPSVLHSPCPEDGCKLVTTVKAKEVASEPIVRSQREEIEDYIRQIFGDQADNALKIVDCESKFDPERIGDTHLTLIDPKYNELVGDSVGIFQVRTGGKGWNRARANGMTANEFRIKLQDYRYNIDYAKTIFDKSSWSPWTCKKDIK